MQTIYKSSDGHHFDDRRECKLYEDALQDIEIIDRLHFEHVGDSKFYKINSEAELYYFDRQNGGEQTLYEIFKSVQGRNFRFPFWIKEDGSVVKSKILEILNGEIDKLQKEIDKIKGEISKLESLDSRTKTPIVDEIRKELSKEEDGEEEEETEDSLEENESDEEEVIKEDEV